MKKTEIYRFLELFRLFSKPHPWHGIAAEDGREGSLRAFIEIVPGDTMKYELDKKSGYLKIDRPQRFSNICPFPYGFVPQTYCGDLVADYCMEKTGRALVEGDADPLDICVITERNISHGNIILDCKPLGGLRMIDGDEADDKIVAVLKGDALYGGMNTIEDLPDELTQRLIHYFLTYKEIPGNTDKQKCEITDIYGSEEAREVIKRSRRDYDNKFKNGKEELIEIIQKGFN